MSELMDRLLKRSQDAYHLASEITKGASKTGYVSVPGSKLHQLKQEINRLHVELIKTKYASPDFNAEEFKHKFLVDLYADLDSNRISLSDLSRTFVYSYLKRVVNPFQRLVVCQALIELSNKNDLQSLPLWRDFVASEGIATTKIVELYDTPTLDESLEDTFE